MGQALTEKRQKELLTLSERLGIVFRDLSLLDQALTHTSYANESVHRKVVHNERLEFLGDAVLELSTSTYLFKHFPMMPEGDLTKARASVVCEAALHRRAAEVDLGAFLLLGNGEQATGGRERPSILADAFEAVIGALYLDQGWQAVSDYVVRQLRVELLEVEHGQNIKDYKTMLQEIVQKNREETLSYRMAGQEGPDHNKTFRMEVLLNSNVIAEGVGHSKKEAEQVAAHKALQLMGVEP